MGQTSIYLKGDDKYPDLGYKNRLKEFGQVVNPKPDYVAPETQVVKHRNWEAEVTSVYGQTTKYKIEASNLDQALIRVAREIPHGTNPEVTITLTKAE